MNLGVVVTNNLGLQMAGIAPDSPDPPGGEFMRDAALRLTGMLLERPAFSNLTRLLPLPNETERRSAIRIGIKAYNRAGPACSRASSHRSSMVICEYRFPMTTP